MIIAVNVGFWHHGYHRQVTVGIMNYADKHPEVKLFVADSEMFVPAAVPVKPDGIVGRLPEEAFPGDTIPIVSVLEHPEPGTVHIGTDDRAIAGMAFEYFRGLGLRNLAVLDSARLKGVRCRPFVNICHEHGYMPYVFRYGGRLVIESIEAQHARLVREVASLPKPAGLFLTLDNHWKPILDLCDEVGIRVPEELAVLGVNNDDEYCQACRPTLSSIDPNGQQIGYEAMAALVAMINGESVPDEILIPPKEVVARESTECRIDEHPDMSRVLDYLHAHLTEPLEVEDLVALQPLRRRAFEKQFQKTCGMPPKQYLLSLRLQKVRQLLATTQLTVNEIGEQCGIIDPSYLCLLFRKRHGLTPLAYREVHR